MWRENLVPLCLLKSFLDFGIRPISPGVQYFEVYHLDCLVYRIMRDSRLICDVGSKAHIRPREDIRTYLEENEIDKPPLLASAEYHRVVVSETKVHILVQADAGIEITAELIASRCGYCDSLLP